MLPLRTAAEAVESIIARQDSGKIHAIELQLACGHRNMRWPSRIPQSESAATLIENLIRKEEI